MNDNESTFTVHPDDLRDFFDANAGSLDRIYAALTWPQKATLLTQIIRAGDHPPGFVIEGTAPDFMGGAE